MVKSKHSSAEMSRSRRSVYAIVGLFAGAGVDVLKKLLAAAIAQVAFGNRFTLGGVICLAITAAVGLLVGYWLGGPVRVPSSESRAGSDNLGYSRQAMMPRLRAILSYAKLRGKGVTWMDIIAIGSWVDVDTRD